MGKTLTGKQREKLIKQFGHVPTKEEIFQKIEESQERLVSSLAGMWQTAPDSTSRASPRDSTASPGPARNGRRGATGSWA